MSQAHTTHMPPVDRLFDEQRSIELVQHSFARTADPRLRRILDSLIAHVHTFVKDVQPTEAEWATAIDYLTRTGQRCDGIRQEFRLLSDVLGVSMLVETLNNRVDGAATETALEGPFHFVVSPPRELGANIAEDGKGEPCLVTGSVSGPDGMPIPGSSVDVWHANAEGVYDVLRPDVLPKNNLRGRFSTDDEGAFWFRSVVPSGYQIPDDGPVGELLHATGRHRYRPAHIHFEVSAPGFQMLTTQIFVAGTPPHRLRRAVQRHARPVARVPGGRRPGTGGEVRPAQPVPHRAPRHRPARRRRGPAESRSRFAIPGRLVAIGVLSAQQCAEAAGGDGQPAHGQQRQVERPQQHAGIDHAEHQPSDDLDALVERRRLDEQLQPARVDADREARARLHGPYPQRARRDLRVCQEPYDPAAPGAGSVVTDTCPKESTCRNPGWQKRTPGGRVQTSSRGTSVDRCAGVRAHTYGLLGLWGSFSTRTPRGLTKSIPSRVLRIRGIDRSEPLHNQTGVDRLQGDCTVFGLLQDFRER
jgi:catechol 1,2-dioxygenase